MKSINKIIGIFFAVTLMASCSANYHANKNGIPPGQAKKITGAQSAKDYAPGQQKNKNKN
jgi:hypothetical protein